MENTKHLNGYIEEKDDTFYPTCRFCGKQTLPDAPYLSQDEANEAATIRCDCFEAREYQEKLRKEKERADNIIKLRQRLDDFSEYSASRGVELTGELHDLLLNVGIAITATNLPRKSSVKKYKSARARFWCKVVCAKSRRRN